MKYKRKFHCKQPWQTGIECSQQILIPHDWKCSADFLGLLFLSLWYNWSCVIGIFSFVLFLWIFSLLSVMAHLLKALFQEAFLFSTVHWMPSHSNFVVVHIEEPRFFPNSSWSHMMMSLKYLNHFSNTTQFSHWIQLYPTYTIGLPWSNSITLI